MNVKKWLIKVVVIDFECDKSCDIWEYLNYKKCKCRNKLVDQLVEERSENIDGNEIIYNGILNNYGNVCNSCAIYMYILYCLSLLFQ